MEDNKAKIRQFLMRFFRKVELDDDDDIFGLGLVNSLFAMQLVMFLEKEFSVVVENEDMNLDNFRTINRMIGFIEAKSATA